MPIYKTKDENFFKKWSPEMAYVLGFFAADGNMSPHSNGGRYIEFTSCDKEVLLKIRNLLGSTHKIALRLRGEKREKSYRIQIGSKEIYKDLLKLGMMPTKSLVLKFPDIPTKYLRDFVRGYFDGDGCVSIGKYWRKDRSQWKWEITSRFTSGSKEFLEKLWSSVKPNCAGGYLYEKNRGYELVFSRHDSVALYDLMYHNIPDSLYLDRKYRKFQKGFKKLNYLGT